MPRRLLITFAMLLSLMLMPLTPTRTTPALAQPAGDETPIGSNPTLRTKPGIATSSDEAFTRLSPDLRKAVRNGDAGSKLVSIRVLPGTQVEHLMISGARSRTFGAVEWVSGSVKTANLIKIATLPGVFTITSSSTYQPLETPGLDEVRDTRASLTPAERRALITSGGKAALIKRQAEQRAQSPAKTPQQPALPPAGNVNPQESANAVPQGFSSDVQARATSALRMVREIQASLKPDSPRPLSVLVSFYVHFAFFSTFLLGYTGDGVTVAVVDTGVDFANPDLVDTYAVITGTGAYDGWPQAYDVFSGINYAIDPASTIGPDTFWDLNGDTYYAHTLPITNTVCNNVTCTADLLIDYGNLIDGWDWDPVTITAVFSDTSISGNYRYTVHPDFNLLAGASDIGLGYADSDFAPAAVIVVDETTGGVYDTVYVDSNFDADFLNDKPMTRDDPISGADLWDGDYDDSNPDGFFDLSAGILTWIADGTNPPPGVNVLYEDLTTPQAGRLIAFLGDEDGHGTSCAGDVVAQGNITDPFLYGVINPFTQIFPPVNFGMAPAAQIMAFQNGYFPTDSWMLAALGFDGDEQSGDEAQVVSNSFGYSDVLLDGWDGDARLAHYLNRTTAPQTVWLTATGNGGPGYGTVTTPGGGTNIDVGASTLYGSVVDFEQIEDPGLITVNNVTPFSNRGPGALGDLAPDITAVGAWGTAPVPLNLSDYNGEIAYDTFGGTSMATPIAAGVMAQIYEAYYDANGDWPTYDVARAIMFNSAYDLGYDVLSQGSGDVSALQGVLTALGAPGTFTVQPPQWYPGGYRGQKYENFPAIMTAGQSSTQVFSITNPTSPTLQFELEAVTLERNFETIYDLTIPEGPVAEFDVPSTLLDISSLIESFQPDLIRAQVIHPFDEFNPTGNYDPNDTNGARVLFYNWIDEDLDGTLWTDLDGNGVISGTGEIDTGEYIRFAYGYPRGNTLEVSLGATSYLRAIDAGSDGVFFGVQRRRGTDELNFKVRLTFYKQTPWDLVNLSRTSVTVPATTTTTFNATMNVPAGTRPGVYQGAIRVTDIDPDGYSTLIPAVAHVAAGGTTFSFGASALTDPYGPEPYDNGHVFGGYDWDWRYEAGDWRLYYYDVPNGVARNGRAMIIDTRWRSPQTDIDTWLFGAAPYENPSLAGDPAFYGPQDVAQIGGSADTNIGGGVFAFNTATDGPREIVGGAVSDGLGFILLHNVLNGGQEFGEPVVGQAYQVDVLPSAVELTTTLRSGTVPFSFTTSRPIPEGLKVLGFGLGQTEVFTGQTATQDDPDDIRTASYTRTLTIQDSGRLRVSTSSSATGVDVDLYLFYDTNENGRLDFGTDEQLAGSAGGTASESIELMLPEDGTYFVVVHGWGVPGGSRPFDLEIEDIGGNNIGIQGVPNGAAGGTIGFTMSYTRPAALDATYEGLIFLGPANAPTALTVPVRITFIVNEHFLPVISKP